MRALEPTPLQHAQQALKSTLLDVQKLTPGERAVFADLATRMIVNSLGAELVVVEAEEALRQAA